MSNYTPGPWNFRKGLSQGEIAVRAESGHWICLCFNEQPGRAPSNANAALIASAPEMLEELKDVLHVLEQLGIEDKHQFSIREAISKAEGGIYE